MVAPRQSPTTRTDPPVERCGRDPNLADERLGADDGTPPARPPAEEPDLDALDHGRADHEHDVPRRGHREDRRQDGENQQQLDDDDRGADVDLLNSFTRLGTRMRMQPCEAEKPIEAASGSVDTDRGGRKTHPARAERIPRPGRNWPASSPLRWSGGRHHGFSCLSTIDHVPAGEGYWAEPVATPKVRTVLSPL